MSSIYIVIMAIAIILAAYGLTGRVKQYTICQRILDVPNERSSHVSITPRGGGMGFVFVFLLCLCFLLYIRLIELNLYLALVGGGLIIAIVGWIDDKRGLSAGIRSVFHLLAAAWAIYWLGGFSAVNLGFTKLNLSWLGSVLAVIGIVWMINLYNFMDGIDGIAGTEAICVALGAGILLIWMGSKSQAYISICLACSVGGFLFWNWPPAKIFMGDVGSGFLGFVFAVLAIASEKSGSVPFIIWIMLLGVFVVDATVTLVRRLYKREKLSEAHRSHVYQLAIQCGYSHRQVTLTVLFINMGLASFALAAFYWRSWMLGISLGVALILVVVHIMLYRLFSTVLLTRHQQLGLGVSRLGSESLSQVAVSNDN